MATDKSKMKALTFSYDDGVTQDIRLIEMLNKYGLKSTFNLNSGLLGVERMLILPGKEATHNKVKPEEVAEIYAGHEVAVHTVTHPKLRELSKEEIIHEVEADRMALKALVGYEIAGMAYPGGGQNNDERVAKVIRDHTKMQYARTIECNYSFEIQDWLYQFKPTVYHMEFDKMFELGEKFIELEADKQQIFYIWGHSYEFDFENTWDKFEKFCQMMSGHDDIFYGTNRQVFGFEP